MAKKRRTAAQRAATRKMIAANRSRRKAPARKRRVRKNPAPAAARRRARSNPRRAAAPARRRSPARRNPSPPVRRRRRRARSNPMTLNVRRLTRDLFRPALNGVAGSLVVDGAFGYLPIPDQFRTGYGRHGIKAALAVLLGVVGGRFFNPRTATGMALGSLTVTGHEIGRELVATYAPDVALDGLGMPLGAYITGPGAGPTMGAYVTGAGASPQGQLGYTNPAMTSGGGASMPGAGMESAHYAGAGY